MIAPHRRHWAVTCCCLAAAPIAWSADGPFANEAKAVWQEKTKSVASAYEVTSVVRPSMGDPSAGMLAAPALPGSGSHNTQHVEVTRWLAPGVRGGDGFGGDAGGSSGSSFGLSLGMGTPAPSAAAQASASPPMSPTSLDLGVRWRSRLDGARHIDISAWARAPRWSPPQDALGMVWQTQPPMYGTRVEMQWASSKTRGLVPEFGAIGVQLQGGSRLLLRARKGGPMLYYRARF